MTRLLFAALALAFATGCTRVTLVTEGSPIRIGPDARARVYVLTDDGWVLSPDPVMIPEGWYCVPPSFVDDAPAAQ